MASKLRRIVASIEATYVASTGDETVEFVVGRIALREHGQRRRVCFVPIPSEIEPPQEGYGRTVGGDPVRLCGIRVDRSDMYVTAEDDEQTECLFERILAAAHNAVNAQLRSEDMGPYSWVTEEDGQQGITNWTPMIRCTVAFRLPMVGEFEKLTTVTAQDHTCNYVDELPE